MVHKTVKVATNPDLITSLELSDDLGLHDKTLERWAREGRGPRRFRIGQRAYYHRPDVENWIESQVREYGRGADPLPSPARSPDGQGYVSRRRLSV